MTLFDSHIHIDFFEHPSEVIHAFERQRTYALFVTYLPALFRKHAARWDFKSRKYVRLAVGYHPAMAANYEFDLEQFAECAAMTDYVGEVGLDRKEPSWDRQLLAFEQIAKHCGPTKVLSIHSRKAEKSVLDILERHDVRHAIMHWYSGPVELVPEFVSLGCFFSVNVGMTRSKNGQKILKSIPTDRLLFESDGPFTRIDGEIVRPENMETAHTHLSEQLDVSFQDVTEMNFRRLMHEFRANATT